MRRIVFLTCLATLHLAHNSMNRRVTEAAQIKPQRAKHASDPNSPAPGTLLSTVLPTGVATLLEFPYSSGDASAPPPENQRDYEQHKEYNEQKFRDAR